MTEARMNVGGKDIRYVDEDDLIEVESLNEIPRFVNEAEEAAFWDTHTLSSAAWCVGGRDPEEIRKATEIILARRSDTPSGVGEAGSAGSKESLRAANAGVGDHNGGATEGAAGTSAASAPDRDGR